MKKGVKAAADKAFLAMMEAAQRGPAVREKMAILRYVAQGVFVIERGIYNKGGVKSGTADARRRQTAR